jgi:hypothetical protein
MTFATSEVGSRQRFRHVVSTIGLASDSKGIPYGFRLTALCGAEDCVGSIELFPQVFESMCRTCKAMEAARS